MKYTLSIGLVIVLMLITIMTSNSAPSTAYGATFKPTAQTEARATPSATRSLPPTIRIPAPFSTLMPTRKAN